MTFMYWRLANSIRSDAPARFRNLCLAARYEPNAANEWRKVFLRRDADDDCWTLHDENGNPLDEPDSGCPGTGFTTASILADMSLVGLE